MVVNKDSHLQVQKPLNIPICLALTAHNLQKRKSTFLTYPENLLDRSSWPKKFQFYLKNYDFCENVKFVAILWKIYILSIN